VLQVELTKKKIKKLRDALDSKNSVFTEKRLLESLGSPDKIIGRQNEAEKILGAVYPKDGYMISFVSIYGSSGTGKSTVVKLVCESLEDIISYSFVNLRKAKTIFGCTNLILTSLDCEHVKSSAGINAAMDLIEKQIVEILKSDKKQHFILVLDEFDEIFTDIRYSPSDFVYKLLHLVEKIRAKGFWLCIASVSNSSLSDYQLDDRVKSRMDSCEIFFRPYTEKDLKLILKERATKAFANPIGEDVLERCAQLSGEQSGDCRRALQLLRVTGELAENSIVDAKKVDEAAEMLDEDNLEQVLKAATVHQKMLLLALAKCTLYSGREEHSTKEIFERYESINCLDVCKIGYRRAFELLSSLESSGIIVSRSKSGGRHGYKKFYRLAMNYDVVGYLIDMDVWCEMRGQKERAERYEEEARKKYRENQILLKSWR